MNYGTRRMADRLFMPAISLARPDLYSGSPVEHGKSILIEVNDAPCGQDFQGKFVRKCQRNPKLTNG
jgi:hypothetical protein